MMSDQELKELNDAGLAQLEIHELRLKNTALREEVDLLRVEHAAMREDLIRTRDAGKMVLTENAQLRAEVTGHTRELARRDGQAVEEVKLYRNWCAQLIHALGEALSVFPKLVQAGHPESTAQGK